MLPMKTDLVSMLLKGYDCDGICLTDMDGDGVCDEFEVYGCIYSQASNYDMMATDDDGSWCVCGLLG